jgi:hypothetical protein
MRPVEFPECNVSFGPPKELDESQCMTIKGYTKEINSGNLDGTRMIVVAWQPDNIERERISKGGPVFLTMLGGLNPHFLTTDFQNAINV